MTKKDYELIAKEVWRTGFIVQLEKNQVKLQAMNKIVSLVANNLASSLAQENPRFDRTKFLKACGIEGKTSQLDSFIESVDFPQEG